MLGLRGTAVRMVHPPQKAASSLTLLLNTARSSILLIPEVVAEIRTAYGILIGSL
jgi:hypothetical protein